MDMMDDHDPVETQEWVDSIKAVLHYGGPERVRHLLGKAADEAALGGTHAGDLIGEVCLAVEMGCNPVDVGKTIHPHPTLCESIGMAAEVFEGVYTNLPPARRR
jgi:dihydrolipoamide dehydrogenase